jgi:uncharacterized protein DUF1835
MLHLTNGDAAADVIRAAVDGDVVPWRDVLHEGPVPDVPHDELRQVRARFLSDGESPRYDEILAELTERDRRLAQRVGSEEVVLWFEHDLYDQLQLLQVLDALSGGDCATGAVTMVCGAEYVGTSTPERLRERFGTRAPVTTEQLALGKTAWAAFRSPDPSRIVWLLDQNLFALPFLHAALTRHLQQFPSTFNGLSRSEQAGLEAVADGAARMADAFVRSHHQREDPVFLGDATFADYMTSLSRARVPLVAIADADRGMEARLRITDAGRAVLRGDDDHVALNGIDKWLGGVHLQGAEAEWQWTGALSFAAAATETSPRQGLRPHAKARRREDTKTICFLRVLRAFASSREAAGLAVGAVQQSRKGLIVVRGYRSQIQHHAVVLDARDDRRVE